MRGIMTKTEFQRVSYDASESLEHELLHEYLLMSERCRELEQDIVRLKGWLLEYDTNANVGDPFSPDLPETDDE